jgi:hypothetical protein
MSDDAPRRVTRVLTAKYGTECHLCVNRIKPGDKVAKLEAEGRDPVYAHYRHIKGAS